MVYIYIYLHIHPAGWIHPGFRFRLRNSKPWRCISNVTNPGGEEESASWLVYIYLIYISHLRFFFQTWRNIRSHLICKGDFSPHFFAGRFSVGKKQSSPQKVEVVDASTTQIFEAKKKQLSCMEILTTSGSFGVRSRSIFGRHGSRSSRQFFS